MKFDFNKKLKDNKRKGLPYIVAHRGVCGANIPCNTFASFEIAIKQGADVVELDVSKSLDGKLFVFHPGTEKVYIKNGQFLKDMYAKDIEKLRLLNQDETSTSYSIPYFEDILNFLKNKVYINVDKYLTNVPLITNAIKRCGVEDQVIVKSNINEQNIKMIEEFAPHLMFLPIIKDEKELIPELYSSRINFIGAEVLFKKDTDQVISKEFIEKMHQQEKLVWANSIIYDEKDIIGGIHTDDYSLTKNEDLGWGWLIDRKVDFIQTDWTLSLNTYLNKKYIKEK